MGAEISVVRERDLETDKVELINVRRRGAFVGLCGSTAWRPHAYGLDPSQWYVTLDDLDGLFPATASTTLARIEIEQVPSGHKLWAFVSVTNVETQHVTTISPQ